VRVLLFSSSSGSRGGGELYLLNLSQGLLSAGHDVLPVLSSNPQMDELSLKFSVLGLPAHRIEYKNTYLRKTRCLGASVDNCTQRRIAEFLATQQADIVHINQQTVEDAMDLLLAGHLAQVAAVTTVHQPASMQGLRATGGRVRDFIARRAFCRSKIDAIAVSHASSRQLSAFLRRRHREPFNADLAADNAGLVYTVPNGIRQTQPGNRAEVRAKCGIPDNATVLACLGRIEFEKNPDFFCEILKSLPTSFCGLWVGEGRLRVRMEQKILDLGLENRVHITGWKDNAASLLSAADVFLLPSLYEGLPLALLEAMSLKLPCVVSDVDGTLDAITNDVTGLRCKVNHLDAWRSSILKVVECKDLANRLGSEAYKAWEARFSLEAMTKRTVAVYEDVIRRR
jgi:glycosyltransferase involved in cell wall biosynthesis